MSKWDWENDFEEGNYSQWDGTFESDANDVVAIEDTIVAFGDYSSESFTLGTADEAYVYKQFVSGYTAFNTRAEVYFQSLPGNGLRLGIMAIVDGNGDTIGTVFIENAGGVYYVSIYNSIEDDIYSDSFSLNAETWYTFLFSISRDDIYGMMAVYIDEATVVQKLNIDTKSSFEYNEIRLGIVGPAFNTMSSARVYIDRVAVDNYHSTDPTTSTSTTTTTSTTSSSTTSTSTSTTSLISTTSTTATSTTSTTSSKSTTSSTSTSGCSTTSPPERWCNGFEEGTFEEWDGTNNLIVIQTGNVHWGTYSASARNYSWVYKTVGTTECYIRFWVKLTDMNIGPTGNWISFCKLVGTDAVIGEVGIEGALIDNWWCRYRNGSSYVEDQGFNMPYPDYVDEWQCVEIYYKYGSSLTGVFSAWGNGQHMGDVTVSNAGAGTLEYIQLGWIDDTISTSTDARVNVDDFCFDSIPERIYCYGKTKYGDPTDWIWETAVDSLTDVPVGDPTDWDWEQLDPSDSDVPFGVPGDWFWEEYG